MTDLEQKALHEIKRIASRSEGAVTNLSVKNISKDEISNEKDIYPIGSDLRDIIRWVDAILKNNG